MSHKKPWKTLSVSYPITSPFFKLRKEIIKVPGSKEKREYFIHESRGWACIFCVTIAGTVVLNWQYKHGIGRYVLELPSGGLEEGESPRACARRELLEETGYVADKFEFLGSFIVDPTNNDGIMHLFYCDNARPNGRRKVDPTEKIRCRFVKIGTLLRLLQEGKIDVLGHVAAIYTVLAKKGFL
jgi:ADP-ribose pyrophosphatase